MSSRIDVSWLQHPYCGYNILTSDSRACATLSAMRRQLATVMGACVDWQLHVVVANAVCRELLRDYHLRFPYEPLSLMVPKAVRNPTPILASLICIHRTIKHTATSTGSGTWSKSTLWIILSCFFPSFLTLSHPIMSHSAAAAHESLFGTDVLES